LGFEFEGEPTVNDADVDFCSGLFVPSLTDGKYTIRLTPKAGRLMAKVFFCDQMLTLPKLRAWTRSVAVGLYPVVAHVPPLAAVFKRVIELTEGLSPRPYRVPPMYLGVPLGEATQDTYIYLMNRYDVSREQINAACAEAQSIRTLPFVLGASFWKMAVARDCTFKTDIFGLGSLFVVGLANSLAHSIHPLLANLITAPLLEEWFKKTSPYGTTFISFCESVALLPSIHCEIIRTNTFSPSAQCHLLVSAFAGAFAVKYALHKTFQLAGTTWGPILHSVFNAYQNWGLIKSNIQHQARPCISAWCSKLPTVWLAKAWG